MSHEEAPDATGAERDYGRFTHTTALLPERVLRVCPESTIAPCSMSSTRRGRYVDGFMSSASQPSSSVQPAEPMKAIQRYTRAFKGSLIGSMAAAAAREVVECSCASGGFKTGLHPGQMVALSAALLADPWSWLARPLGLHRSAS